MSNNNGNKNRLGASKRLGEKISWKSPNRKKTRVNSPIAATTVHLHCSTPSTKMKLSWENADAKKQDATTPTNDLSAEAGGQPHREP